MLKRKTNKVKEWFVKYKATQDIGREPVVEDVTYPYKPTKGQVKSYVKSHRPNVIEIEVLEIKQI